MPRAVQSHEQEAAEHGSQLDIENGAQGHDTSVPGIRAPRAQGQRHLQSGQWRRCLRRGDSRLRPVRETTGQVVLLSGRGLPDEGTASGMLDAPGEHMHAVIGTDGSEHAIMAAVTAIRLLGKPALVTLVTIGTEPAVATRGLESGFAGGVATAEELAAGWKEVESAMQVALDATAGAITEAGFSTPLTRLTKIGDPGRLLCDLARERSADVLVVGSRGRGFLRSALMGSVSTRVVHHAPCPVMVVRREA